MLHKVTAMKGPALDGIARVSKIINSSGFVFLTRITEQNLTNLACITILSNTAYEVAGIVLACVLLLSLAQPDKTKSVDT